MTIQFTLKPIPPFRLDLTVLALRRRPLNQIDRWEKNRYTRIFLCKNEPVKTTVYQIGTIKQPKLIVEAKNNGNTAVSKNGITGLLKKTLGLNIGLDKFYKLVENDEDLQELTYGLVGMKPPCFPTVFEAAVNAVACQQITLDNSIKLLNRLSRRYGTHYDDQLSAFPTPENLYRRKANDLRQLGFSYQKANAIIGLVRAMVEKKLFLEKLENEDMVDVYAYLHQIKGIGRWSIEYILLRGLGKLNVFPGDDAGAQKKLQKYFHTDIKLSYEKVKKLTFRWQPYAGFIYFHLLLNGLMKKSSSVKPLVVTYS